MNMKYVMILILLICVSNIGFSQSRAEQPKTDAIPTADFSTLMEKGIQAHDHGNYAQALRYYQQALQLEKNEWVWYEIGYAYLKMAQYDQALEAFQQSITINSQYSQAYWQMGFILSQRKDYQTSNLCYLMAFIGNPMNRYSLNNIALNLSMVNKRTAFDFYTLLLQRFPSDKIFLYNLAQLFEQTESSYSQVDDIDVDQMFSETITYFTQMVNHTQDIQEFEIAYFMALTSLAYHHMNDAKTYLQQCVSQGDETYKSYCNMIIANNYTVESILTDEELLNGIKRLLQLDKKAL